MKSLRARLLVLLLAVVLLAVGTATAVQIRGIAARLRHDQLVRATAAAAAVEADLTLLASVLDRALETALDPRGPAAGLGAPDAAARRLLWAAGRLEPGRLDVLTVADGQGVVLTSGAWPASLGAVDPDAVRWGALPAGPLPTLAPIPLPSGTGRALVRSARGRWGDRDVVALAGRLVSAAQLATLRDAVGADLLAHCDEGSCLAAWPPGRAPAPLEFAPGDPGIAARLLLRPVAGGYVVGVDRSALPALFASLSLRAGGVAALAALFAILAGALFARRVVAPVEGLADAARAFAAGNVHAAEGLTGGGVAELDALVDAFRAMARDVERSRRDLVRAERVAAWQEIARGLAHELKNPLTPIQASMDVLRRARRLNRPDFDAILLEQATAVVEEVGRLKELADSFARFARLPEPRKEPVPLEALVDGVVALYAAEVTALRGPRAEPPIVVAADPTQLRTAVLNLVKNAVEASEGRPHRTVRVGIERDGAEVLVRVEDDGPGVDPGVRDRLFTPYVTTKGSRGTGLGLALVHRIASEHGGGVDVDTAPLGGARFTLRLPA